MQRIPSESRQRKIELLAPAKNAEVAREAILHGADAVYMGASSHGARKNASNSIEDIRRTVDFAHIFRAKVYVTVNTIILDRELKEVENLVCQLWQAGVDALIVQDMGLLRLDLPPVALHASTQCDNRTPEKARFLQDVGFSQIVLARELTLDEIAAVCRSVTVPVECFAHGALCVSYSGRCHASYATCRRSANRGECAQLCRLPYDLRDSRGTNLIKSRHLLSLKDFNASDRIERMLDAGVSSFKIEGRLKDVAYVKNVTAAYRRIIDEIISRRSDEFARSSFGESEISFIPNLEKSFNRSFTHYFLDSRQPAGLTSPLTPKSLGEPVSDISSLNNGDGISFIDRDGNYIGAFVNGIRNGRIINSANLDIPRNADLRRTYDIKWEKELSRPTASRKIALDISLDKTGVSAVDERGVSVRIPFDATLEEARKPMDFRRHFEKLGDTNYRLRNFSSALGENVFVPASQLAVCRRRLTETLDSAAESTYGYDYRCPENHDAVYPVADMDFTENVSNRLAEQFYRSHGVRSVEKAAEQTGDVHENMTVMTTRHCILRENGMCRKHSGRKLAEPLFLVSGNRKFRLEFDCARCEMKLLYTASGGAQ